MPYESNYWLTTVEQPDFPTLPLPTSVDVAVIGAGLTGLSAARTLARAGASVAVLETHTAGWGASSRNGGMVLAGMKLGITTLIKRYGLERAQRLFALSLAAIDTVEQIVAEENIACNFARTGCLEVAWKASHYAGYAAAAEALEKYVKHKVTLIPKAELHSEIGSDLYHGGLAEEVSAGVNPARLVMGLGRAAANAGAKIHEHTAVTKVQKVRSGGFLLETTRGALRAGQVIAGTSGYTGPATPALQKRVIPIGSYIIATQPLPDVLARELSPKNRMIFDSKHFLYYFRLTPDNRMVFGGRAAFLPENANSTGQSADILRRGMVSVFPQLHGATVEYVWGGNLDFTFDIMPHAGALEGMHHALGYAGHGVAFAAHLGQLVARNMLGQPVENPLADLPFPNMPLYSGNPLLHLPAAWLYYRLLDWLE